MSTTRRLATLAFPLLLAFAPDLNAQASANTPWTAAERALAEGVFDPQADTLLAAATRYTSLVFQVPSLQLSKAVTERTANGDVLLVRWTIDEPFGKGSLILTDAPDASDYQYRLDTQSVRTQADVLPFLTRLITWGKSPLKANVRALGIVKDESGAPIRSFEANLLTHLTQFDGLSDFDIHGQRLDSGGYLVGIHIGKRLVTDYPVAQYVPERFPPLADLVKTWTVKKLLDEAADNHKLGLKNPAERDRILIAELVRRELTVPQVVELLTTPDAPYLKSRANIVADALKSTGQLDLLTQSLASVMNAYEHRGALLADSASTELFKVFHRACSPQVEQQAVTELKHAAFFDGALTYLYKCSASAETASFLGTVTIPADYPSLTARDQLRYTKRSIEYSARRNQPAAASLATH